MNRPGQPPQRPPNLGPQQQMGGPFRGYAPYGALPPRGVMQFPGMQNHRAQQNMVPQTSTNFVQQRTTGNAYQFSTTPGLPTQQQQQQPTSIQQHPQQQQPSAANPSLPPHLSQASSSIGATSDGALDPKDFPALGSAATATTPNPASSNGGSLASYASQAGTGLATSSTGGAGSGPSSTPRDFTADDFPALGGGSGAGSTPQTHESHPPGLNGFPQSTTATAAEQHRQNMLGSMQNPSLASGALRTTQPSQGYGSDVEKRVRQYPENFPLKANHVATAAAWNQQQQQAGGFSTNGLPSQQAPPPQQQHVLQPSANQQQAAQTSQLQAPPGVPPPSFAPPQQQQNLAPSQTQLPQTSQTPSAHSSYSSPGDAHISAPAQQILMSAADRWGLLALLQQIKNPDENVNFVTQGLDLSTMGLNMSQPGYLYQSFITPWTDSRAASEVEPEFHLPACYNVKTAIPGPSKAASFSDETLFFMFYSSPRDVLQEVAAQELYNRNWRFHKLDGYWLTKETGTSPSQKTVAGETGTYTIWDVDRWERVKKDMIINYPDLEEKTGVIPVQVPPNQAVQQQAVQPAVQQPPRAFQQGMNIGIPAM